MLKNVALASVAKHLPAAVHEKKNIKRESLLKNLGINTKRVIKTENIYQSVSFLYQGDHRGGGLSLAGASLETVLDSVWAIQLFPATIVK